MARDRWNTDESFDVPLTAMLDVIFNLLFFFLVATTFYTEERDLKVRLPDGTQGEMIVREQKRVVVNVRQEGVIVIDNRLLSLDELGQKLAGLARDRQIRIEIRGDANARHGTIMAVMNLCKQHGISDYALTQRIIRDVD